MQSRAVRINVLEFFCPARDTITSSDTSVRLSHVLEFMKTLVINTFFQLGRGRHVVYKLLITRLPATVEHNCIFIV